MTRRLDDPQLVREQYASEHSNRRHREEVFDLIACPQSAREWVFDAGVVFVAGAAA